MRWKALAAIGIALGLVMGGVAIGAQLRSSQGTVEIAPAGAAGSAAFKGLSEAVSRWLQDPGCEAPSIKISAADFENEGVALKDSLTNAWHILSAKCTAGDGELDAWAPVLYAIPTGTIVRDPNNGHSWLVRNGLASIPTGGDYECFVAQGHSVINLAGVSAVGFTNNPDAVCDDGSPTFRVDSSAPPVTCPDGTVLLQGGPCPAPPSSVTPPAPPTPPPAPPSAPPPAAEQSAPPTPQQQAPTPPAPEQAPPPPAPEPTPKNFHVEDDFYGGTWARNDPNDGTWHSKSNQPANGAYWYGNGSTVAVSCAQSAAAYKVRFADGHYEQWTWWLRLTDGTWYPAAATQEIFADGNPGVAPC